MSFPSKTLNRLMSSRVPDSSRNLPNWLAVRSQVFQKLSDSSLRFKDSGFTQVSDFRREVDALGLNIVNPGYAAKPVSSDLNPWSAERELTLRKIDYVAKRRADHREQVVVSLAGLTAAHLLGLPTITRHPDHLVRQVGPGHTHFRSANVRTFRAPVEPHVVDICGMRVSSPAQVVIDLARLVSVEDGLACANFVLHEELATEEDIFQIYDSMPRFNGASRVRRVLSLMDGRIESAGESLTLLRLNDFGFPSVEPQVSISSGVTVDRVDFLDRVNGIVYEFDGLVKLLDPDMVKDLDYRRSIANDGARDRRIRQHGFAPYHLVWEDVSTAAGFSRWVRQARADGLPF